MTITTSKGLEYVVDWIDTPLSTPNQLILQMADERLFSVIAPEFEGLERVERFDEQQGDKVYEGYTVLRQIVRNDAGRVMIFLSREVT